MNYLVKILSITTIYLSISLSFANKDSVSPYEENGSYNNYYENEGKLLMKIYGIGVYANDSQTNFNPPVSENATTSTLFKSGLGGEVAAAFFVSNYIAAEINLGVYGMNVNKATLNNIAQNYGSTQTIASSSSSTSYRYAYGVPIYAIAQFHLAPFGGIRPYIGAGYGMTLLYSQYSQLKFSQGHGAVFQAGVDFVAKNDMILSFNVKQYLLKTKVTYAQSFTGQPNVTSKVKINPLTFGLGIGFSF